MCHGSSLLVLRVVAVAQTLYCWVENKKETDHKRMTFWLNLECGPILILSYFVRDMSQISFPCAGLGGAGHDRL